MGTSLRDIVFSIGGGIPKKRKFKAVQMGGPSGGCLPEDQLDTPTDYEAITKAGAIMGSGGMIVMDDTTCMVDMARFFMDFCQEESCGKCTPCREGTKQILNILERITKGEGKPEDLDTLEELSHIIKDSALCGLGQTAPNPVLSTLRYFRHEYEAHINEKICPAHACVELVEFVVDEEKCTMCGLCYRACPVDAITWEKKQPAKIDKGICVKCMSCIAACRFDAIS
jgi:NADH-quinone oxidoreductase subunit F/NAD(P)H dehydrogenase (quinone)/NADP-reducing hydrogenase subunit HndC